MSSSTANYTVLISQRLKWAELAHCQICERKQQLCSRMQVISPSQRKTADGLTRTYSFVSHSVLNVNLEWHFHVIDNMNHFQGAYLWLWTTKPVIRVSFYKFCFFTSFENIIKSFPLMYDLLGQDNIWLKYNYLKIWNLRVQKSLRENRL